MAASALVFAEADDELWHEYDLLARRAYGQPVEDIARLGAHADRRVALRGGKVVAGGVGMLIPQWFGGRPVPSAHLTPCAPLRHHRSGPVCATATASAGMNAQLAATLDVPAGKVFVTVSPLTGRGPPCEPSPECG